MHASLPLPLFPPFSLSLCRSYFQIWESQHAAFLSQLMSIYANYDSLTHHLSFSHSSSFIYTASIKFKPSPVQVPRRGWFVAENEIQKLQLMKSPITVGRFSMYIVSLTFHEIHHGKVNLQIIRLSVFLQQLTYTFTNYRHPYETFTDCDVIMLIHSSNIPHCCFYARSET